MSVEMLTYATLGERLGCSREVARALAKRLRLPRQRANDGKALMSVDVAELNHAPILRTVTTRPPHDHQAVAASLKARIKGLEAELSRLEAAAAVHRADLQRERERGARLIADVLKTTADLMGAREAAARLAVDLAALRPRP